jgi:hypothetical protein
LSAARFGHDILYFGSAIGRLMKEL